MKQEKLVHFLPFRNNSNVRCLNGDAHRRASYNFREVTCPKCKDKDEAKEYWAFHKLETDQGRR